MDRNEQIKAQIVNISASFTRREQVVFWLRFDKRWKEREIAEALNITQPAVHYIIERISDKLDPHREWILETLTNDHNPESRALLAAMN